MPTLAEAGVAGYEATIWVGVMAPAGTPQPIVELLNKEINKILARPDVKEAWEKQGAEPMVMTPDEFGAHVQSEIEKWAKDHQSKCNRGGMSAAHGVCRSLR